MNIMAAFQRVHEQGQKVMSAAHAVGYSGASELDRACRRQFGTTLLDPAPDPDDKAV